MAVNRGKDFEKLIKESFESIPNVSVDRLHDQMNGYAGSCNICDFIVYKKPLIYYIECKTVHGNTLPFSNITKNQWNGLLNKSRIDGAIAGVMCWWVDKDVTKFLPIQLLENLKRHDDKSIPYQADLSSAITLHGDKKQVFFNYDVERFFKEVQMTYEMHNLEGRL